MGSPKPKLGGKRDRTGALEAEIPGDPTPPSRMGGASPMHGSRLATTVHVQVAEEGIDAGVLGAGLGCSEVVVHDPLQVFVGDSSASIGNPGRRSITGLGQLQWGLTTSKQTVLSCPFHPKMDSSPLRASGLVFYKLHFCPHLFLGH